MKKKLIKIVGVLFALLIIGFVVVYFMLGSIIKKGVETVGPDMTKGGVTLDSASLSVFGSGGLKGLQIDNPKDEGFTSPFAFKLGSADVSLQIGSVMSDKIIINSILIDGAEVCFEGVTGSNHKKILENIKAYTGTSEAKPDETPEAPKEGEGKKIIIKLFKMTNTKILLHVFGQTVPITLPDFEKKNIGEEEGGASLKDTVVAIYDSLFDSVTGLVKSSGDQIKKITGKTMDAITGAGKGVIDGAKEGVGGAVDKLKGIFK